MDEEWEGLVGQREIWERNGEKLMRRMRNETESEMGVMGAVWTRGIRDERNDKQCAFF